VSRFGEGAECVALDLVWFGVGGRK
jgi:hypothetical protein